MRSFHFRIKSVRFYYAILIKMKAIVCDGYGGPEVLKVGERPMPVLASDEVLIKVDYAGVNRAETL